MVKIDSTTRKATPAKLAPQKKILIVDDHPMMREGLRGIINREPDLIVCKEAENARQAMEAVAQCCPDLALVDITLPGKSGLELVKDLKVLHPQLAILANSMHDESLYAERMLRAGARGYITKQQPPEELIKAIREVLATSRPIELQPRNAYLRRLQHKLANQSHLASESIGTDPFRRVRISK